MHLWLDGLKTVWLLMLEPPWHYAQIGVQRNARWFFWLAGWFWMVAGLLLGALVAASLIQPLGITDEAYQTWLVLGVAILAGFLVQALGVAVLAVFQVITPRGDWKNLPFRFALLLFLLLYALAALPIVGVAYGIYRYLTWLGPGQSGTLVALVVGMALKATAPFLCSLILNRGRIIKIKAWLLGKTTKRSNQRTPMGRDAN